MHFLALLFFLLSVKVNEVHHVRQTFKLILRVAPVLFLAAVFSFFSCLSVNFTFTLLYLIIYTNYRTFVVLLENCNTAFFDFLRM